MKDIFGPWALVKEPGVVYCENTGKKKEFVHLWVRDTNDDVVALFTNKYSDIENHHEIANMIAAAPQMYEALDGVEFWVEDYLRSAIETNERINERDGCTGEDRHVRNIRESLAALKNALKKARGEA